MFEAIAAVALPLLAIYAGCTDFFAKIIPNRVPLLAVAFYAVAALGLGAPLAVVGSGVAAMALVLGLGLIPFALGYMGAGDVKLAAAAALWLGLGQTLPFLMLVSLFGGLMVLLMVVYRDQIRLAYTPRIAFFAEAGTRMPLPYGIAIAAAALMLHPTSPLLALVGG
jgi:prepilin peptidase CpaA